MSHSYAHIIAEVEPGKHYYLADKVRWTEEDDIDDDSELSSNPAFKGGPFPSVDTAIDAMTSRHGNPGYIDAISHESFLQLDEWKRESLLNNVNPEAPAAPSM